MKIAVVGTGYVGLVSGTCFAQMGNQVVCVDVDQVKIDKLERGIIPIFEPGLEELVIENHSKGRLLFSTKLSEAIQGCEIVFIAVGTPMGEDGSADLKYVLSVAQEIGVTIQQEAIIVDKSTVPVGTADKVKMVIARELDKRGEKIPFYVVSNPEFLKEGAAIDDFMQPDRVVVGTDHDYALKKMKELYSPFTLDKNRFIEMDIRSAELTKYAANAMLATKISFINEISNVAEKLGADINMVRMGIGSDQRIGYHFIHPGLGFGGSCFPKDVNALIRFSDEVGFDTKILKAVNVANQNQRLAFAQRVIDYLDGDLHGKVIAVWGLSFKPNTDDMREAPAIDIINTLTKAGAKVKAYDPKAIKEAQECYLKGNKSVTYFNSKYDALDGGHALLLITDWREFRSPDFDEIKKRLSLAVIFDGRNQYKAFDLEARGITHFQIGVAQK